MTGPTVRTVTVEDGVDSSLDVQVKILDHHLTDEPGDRLLHLSYANPEDAADAKARIAFSVEMLRRVLAAVDEPAEGPVVSLADVTAALVACYPSTVGNATDIGVRLGVRGVAEWLGVALDAARAADGQEG